ncbi:monofunctional biosynthetic peptidoglycan transglycosylase [Winogradskyella psychrotolerans]|uniref:monofunctional biosynthetic peptidoglycan transglycosylase n=1 Tax=Winogradskyella psychrotolerans TaxID=1344585 RepID=UPI001C06A802|nr:monofunctional biosynthetic peptidoglycan transglycosylase [Winogradskyella psychrotolerans]MBU2926656.1 monofunctional biosynthetic peptidoglycan transglycosylase [Winogradskyella psychrotolerans]
MKRIFRLFVKLFLWFIVLSVGMVVVFKYVPVPFTPLMILRYVDSDKDTKVWEHDWVPIEEISKNIQLAVICSEDQKFMAHNGFDIEAIEKAYEHNKEGKRIRGGSTISQQTAKNVFLWPDRSWLRKSLEVYFTFLIEAIWSKERILEVYLNSIEMGNGIYGVEAASQHWFNKSGANLTAYEAAAIVAILPNPRTYRANPASAYIQKRKAWIVKQMRFYGKLDLNPQK